MDKRERPIYKAVFFSEEEWQIVSKKMQEADIGSYSVFCREMLLNGEVKHYDFSALKELSSNIGRIGVNINQVAKRCNENHSVTEADVQQLRRSYQELEAVRRTDIMGIYGAITYELQRHKLTQITVFMYRFPSCNRKSKNEP